MRKLHSHAPECAVPRPARACSALVVVALSLGLPAGVLAEETSYAVARIMIYPGDTVTAAMIFEKPNGQARPTSNQDWATREQAIGKVARRTLLPHQPIALQALRMPDIVHSGKTVNLVYTADGIVITAQGLALQSGGAGAMVSVQSRDSNIIVRGRVQLEGTVRVEE